MTARFEADYILDTAISPEKAAATLAGEQSSGTFMAVPGETEELKARSAARVERIEDMGPLPGPALPGATRPDAPHRRYAITLSWPLANTGPSLPNILATVAGNLFELNCVAGLRLTALRMPPEMVAASPGPAFGIAGTRRLSGVEGRPLVGTIVKPSIGLTAEETAAIVATLCEAGIDFIKDDELQADGAVCPFDDRVRAVMRVINDHAGRTGRKVMFAFNLTGEVDEMRRRHDLVLAQGGTCVMASANSLGLTGFLALRRHAELPIHLHRNGWGYLSRHPTLGFDYAAWSVLWRLAGADHMHVNGIRNKFCEGNASVLASARALISPLSAENPAVVMPVFSSGQSALQVHDTWAALGSAIHLGRCRRAQGSSGEAGGTAGNSPERGNGLGACAHTRIQLEAWRDLGGDPGKEVGHTGNRRRRRSARVSASSFRARLPPAISARIARSPVPAEGSRTRSRGVICAAASAASPIGSGVENCWKRSISSERRVCVGKRPATLATSGRSAEGEPARARSARPNFRRKRTSATSPAS